MFLQPEDLKNSIYNYQVDQITESDDSIVIQALQVAEEECRSYLEANVNIKQNQDGRFIYDVENIFNKVGNARNALIVQYCITIAKWYIVELCNADIIMEQAKERYDRVITSLKQLAKGDTTLGSLPIKKLEDDPNIDGIKPFSFGSRKKFNHE